jgi:hypothetical protein
MANFVSPRTCISDLNTIRHTKLAGVFIIYLQQIVLIAVSNGSLVLSYWKLTNIFEGTFYILLKITFTYVTHMLHSFRRSIVINHFKAFLWRGTTVVPSAVPCHNKNVKADYRNYTGTSLLSNEYKTLSSILSRLYSYVAEIIWPSTDHIFCIRPVLYKNKLEYIGAVPQLLTGFKKAYVSLRKGGGGGVV